MQGPKWNEIVLFLSGNILLYLDYVALIQVKFLKKLRKASKRSHNSVHEQLNTTSATYGS